MRDFRKFIIDQIIGDSPLYLIFSKRIYSQISPADTVNPFMFIEQAQPDETERLLSGAEIYTVSYWRINIIDTLWSSLASYSNKVETLFNTLSDKTYGDYTVLWIKAESEGYNGIDIEADNQTIPSIIVNLIIKSRKG